MRRLVEDKPIVLPARNAGTAEPKVNVPLNRPIRRETPQPQRRRGS